MSPSFFCLLWQNRFNIMVILWVVTNFSLSKKERCKWTDDRFRFQPFIFLFLHVSDSLRTLSPAQKSIFDSVALPNATYIVSLLEINFFSVNFQAFLLIFLVLLVCKARVDFEDNPIRTNVCPCLIAVDIFNVKPKACPQKIYASFDYTKDKYNKSRKFKI